MPCLMLWESERSGREAGGMQEREAGGVERGGKRGEDYRFEYF